MLTYGFYDSINHDRRYNAIQFGSIFDGIIQDGIFMSIGNCFRVVPGTGMMVLVGPGRAWFDHTWTLNDAPLPVYIPQSEVILNRIDAIVLDIDSNQNKRQNSIIVVKGTPSNSPQRPALINNASRHQYPLAYISVKSGVTSIRAADITSMVGTSAAPYVTGILKTINIDALLDQWQDQWEVFFEQQSSEMKSDTDFWKTEWRKWYTAQTKEIQDSYLAWKSEWELWASNQMTMMEDTAESWRNLWDAWFYEYINQNQTQITNWQMEWDSKVQTWFENLQVILNGDVAANLANTLVGIQKQLEAIEAFKKDLTTEHAIYDAIVDNEDFPILDSDGHQLGSKIIFVVKE